MGQKTNPISLRLQYNNRHFDSSWYSDYFYTNLLCRELMLQKYLTRFLKFLKLPSPRINIQFAGKKTQLYTFFCYPRHSREFNSKLFQITTGLPNVINIRDNVSMLIKSEKQKKCITNKLLWDSLFSHQYLKNIQGVNKFQSVTSNYDVSDYKKKLSDKNIKNEYSLVNSNSIEKYNTNIKKFITNLLMTNLFQSTYNNTTKVEHFDIANHNKSLNKNLFSTIKLYAMETPIEIALKSFLNFKLFYRNNNLIKFNNFLIHSIKNKKSGFSNEITDQFMAKYTQSLRPLEIEKILQTNIFLNKNSNTSTIDVLKSLKNKNIISSILLSINSRQLQTSFKYQNYIENFLTKSTNSIVSFLPIQSSQDWQSAGFIADELVYFLENRVSFRRLKARILKQLSEQSNILGVRITCAGRVGGKSKKSQRAKVDSIKYGQTSLHVFSSRVDFAVRTAHTALGSVGIKVWVCYK